MLKIFLSGGMSGLTDKEKTGWRELLKEHIDYYDEMKVISPTDFVGSDNYDCDEKEAFDFDLYWIRKCDVVVVNLNKMDSIGTAQEIMLAYTLNKPIIMICETGAWDKIHPWYDLEATMIFYWDEDPRDTADDIASYLYKYYV